MEGRITLRLFHRLRELVGEKKVSISPIPSGPDAVIKKFLEMHPDAEEEMIEDGALSSRYVLAINRNVIKKADWPTTVISDGDEIAFLTMVTGG